jgi:hypothetical protein
MSLHEAQIWFGVNCRSRKTENGLESTSESHRQLCLSLIGSFDCRPSDSTNLHHYTAVGECGPSPPGDVARVLLRRFLRFKVRLIYTTMLLGSQRFNRIDRGSTASRQIARQSSGDNQDQRHRDVGKGIERADTKEQRPHQPHEGRCRA